MPDAIALFDERITNPVEPRHYMQLKALKHVVKASAAGIVIASTSNALRLHEVGYTIYQPVIYFPYDDVDKRVLRKVSNSTYCPLKGRTEYFDVVIDNVHVIEAAAWRYWQPLKFDERLTALQDRVAFDVGRVNVFEYSAGLK